MTNVSSVLRNSRTACIVGGLLSVSCVAVSAQETPRKGLAPSISVTSTTATGVTGATVGARAGLLGLRPKGFGLDFGLGYLLPSRTSEVFPRYGASATDLGLAYLLPLSWTNLVFGAGGSFLLNSNGSADGAPYLKLGALSSLSDRVGIRADLVGRYWLEGQKLGAGLDVGLLWLPAPTDQAQATTSADSSFDGWMFGAGVNLVAMSQQYVDVTMWGPSAFAAWVSTGSIGFETALSYIVPSGFYDFTGVSLDLGLVYAIPLRSSSVILLRAGGTGLVGGDADGTGGAAGAFYAGAGFLQQLAGPLAFRVDLTPRIWVSESTAVTFGGSAALVIVP